MCVCACVCVCVCVWLLHHEDDLWMISRARLLVFTFLLRIKLDVLLITEHCSALCLTCTDPLTGPSSA